MARNTVSGVVWLVLAIAVAVLWWWIHNQALQVQNSSLASFQAQTTAASQAAAMQIGVTTLPIVQQLNAPLGE